MQIMKCSSLLVPLPVSSLWSHLPGWDGWRRCAHRAAHPWVWEMDTKLGSSSLGTDTPCCALLLHRHQNSGKGTGRGDTRMCRIWGWLLCNETGEIAGGRAMNPSSAAAGQWWSCDQHGASPGLNSSFPQLHRRFLLAADTKWRGPSCRKLFILCVDERATPPCQTAQCMHRIWTWQRLNITANFRTIILKAWLKSQSIRIWKLHA